MSSGSLKSRYGAAVLAAFLTVVVRLALDPVLGPHAPYLPFALAIMVVARFGGRGPGFLATALSGIGIEWFFIEPRHSLAVADPHAAAGLALFVVVGSLISLFVGSLRIALDSTTRAEELLRRQTRLVNLSHDAIITTDADRRITGWNAGAEEMYGWTESEALGKTTHELLPTSKQVSTAEIDASLLRNGRWEGELDHIARDGRRVVVESRQVLLREAGHKPVGILEINRDLTERNRAEEALRESEEQFRTLANAIPQLCWMAKSDGSVYWYNQRWYEYTGARPEQMVGWGWQSVHDPEVLPDVLKRWKNSITTGEPFDMVFPLRGADGVFRPFLTRVMPVRDRDERIVRWFGTNTDITEQRQTEEALRESEERLHLAQQVARIGTFEWNIQTGVNRWTPELEAMYGLPRGGFAGTQQTWEGLIHPEDRPKVVRQVGEAIEEKGGVEAEWRVIWPDGTLHWLFGRAWVFKDESGKPLRLIGANIDITGRKHAEEALLESEARERSQAAELRAIMDAVPVATFITRDPGCCRMIGSRATYELLRLPPGSNLSRSVSESAGAVGVRYMRDGKEIPVQELPMQKACATGHPVRNQELEVAFEDGTSRTLFGDAVPMLDENGRTWGVVAAFMDITLHKQADAELRRTHETLNAIVRGSPVPIWALDLNEAVTLWNAAAEQLFGWTREEILGKPLPTIIDHALFRETLASVRAGAVVLNEETRRRRKDGVMLDICYSISPLRDETGATSGYVGVLQDITEKKRMDEQLRHTQKLESIGLLAGGVAHDFNNLLTGIMGHASLVAEALPAEARHSAEEIVRSSERAADLTRQLLAYAGKGQFVFEPLNLSAMVRETTELIHASISKKVEVRLDLDPDLPFIEGDPSQIQQIVMNLVINAAEAIREKATGHIVASTMAVQIADTGPEFNRFTGRPVAPGPYICFEVADDGCGMDAETQSRMFEPFFTTKFTGRGLGLAGVVGIVRSHRGFLEVTSAPGAGTTIRAYMPASTKAVPQGAPDRIQAEGGGETVLIADDEGPVRTFAAAALSRSGYRPLLAENGIDALQIISRRPDISVIVLDLMMPAMSGDEVLEVLRASHSGMRVVLSSGYSEREARRMFGSQTVAGFIQKPYKARDLVAQVRAAIDCDALGRSWP